MKKKDTLILEYAKLASLQLLQGQKTINARMQVIVDELQITHEAIMVKAAQMAIASFK